MGEGAILGEVGSHPFNMACFVSGLKAVRLCARMSIVAASREVYDNAYLSLDYEDGVQGRLWASYVAAGNDQGLWFRIFGEKGSLRWHQEQPDALWPLPIYIRSLRRLLSQKNFLSHSPLFSSLFQVPTMAYMSWR